VSIETQEGKDLLQQLTRLVIAQSKAPQGMTQMVMQPPTDGERAQHRAEKVVYALGGLLVGLIALAVNYGAEIREGKREQQRTQDYLNMLWRAYPEMRETALKAKEAEESNNGKSDRN